MKNTTRREFLCSSLAAGAALSLPSLNVLGANERINFGFIGFGGRGGQSASWFKETGRVNIAAFSDPDADRLAKGPNDYPGAKAYKDLRSLLDDDAIDAVVISTANHWHCLAAIWACQAGKHVYVEKPLGHNLAEEQRVLDAAKKYGTVVQLGTQQRSDPVQAEIKEFLHGEKALGEIKLIRASRYGVRGPIGKRTTPLTPPGSVDYNLWLGPAADQPMYRDALHYDWHWDWNTGNGEMGNWGVHIVDDALNCGLMDREPFPKRILAGGGRVAWKDAGDSPNVHFAYFETDSIPVLFDLSNLPMSKELSAARHYKGTRSGYVVHCENGYYAGGRGGGAAYGPDGKKIKQFKGTGGREHAGNFLDAVEANDNGKLNGGIVIGQRSSAWCTMANLAYRVGKTYRHEDALAINRSSSAWSDLVDATEEHLSAHDIDIADPAVTVSPVLEYQARRNRFSGPGSDRINALLGRTGRGEFAVPDKV